MMLPEVSEQLNAEDSPLNRKLVPFLRQRLQASERRWSQRHDRYREAERLYRSFRDPDMQDRQTREKSLTEGVEKIVVPYSYAVLQSTLAFFMTVFTQRKPIIPVEGMGPNDVRAAILMEHALEHQMDGMQPQGVLVLYQWLFDSLRYGIGVIKNAWTLREWPDLVRVVRSYPDPFSGMPVTEEVVEERDVIAYEGNEALNVSPFDFYPDPRRPLNDFQRGEFVFHRMKRSYTELLQKEAEGLYAGCQFIPRGSDGRGDLITAGHGSDLPRTTEMEDDDFAPVTQDMDGKPYTSLHEGYVYCTPEQLRELGLPVLTASSTPRLWVFTLANTQRCLRAEPANLPGRRFPLEAIEINYDAHAPANFGMIETFRGLSYILNFLFNSRMANVRKSINNEWIVDPDIVNMSDLEDPEPGRLVRVQRNYWGSGKIAEAVMPVPVTDVTAGHYNDSRVVQDLIQTITGANNLILGMPNSGRRAATEVQGMLNLSSGRMKMLVELVTSQGMKPWAKQMARNTQTFLENPATMTLREPYARLFGGPSVTVTAEMLQGDFLFPITDQGMPTDKLFEANTWKEMLQLGLQNGAAAPAFQNFPWLQILGRFLRAMGVKDLQSFGLSLPQLVLMPDEQVQNQMQQGNLAPQGMPADGFALPTAASTPGVGGQAAPYGG